MPLNREPLRPVTDEHRATYERDGAVCLRDVLHPDWIEMLLPVARRIVVDKEDLGLLPQIPGRYMSRTVPDFRRLAFESPLAQVCGELQRSREIRFYFDEFFAKAPRSQEKSIWHTDRMGWPVAGKMVPSLWLPLTPISEENSLEVIAGSQSEDVRYWLFSPNARKMSRPPDRPPHPDCEPLRADPRVRFLRWSMQPGDLLVVHPWALHYSAGNPTDDWRIAVAVRMFGDDITWDPRPDCVNLAGVSFDEMVQGEKPSGPLFPLLWSADGRRDDDRAFPRGFATEWSAARKSGVNEYAEFAALLEKESATASP
ncbi:MAG: phytanoyl-CoA dioxygenase family protein [Steroidobacteraceae bacterium]|jgi:hypothetical protein|nr:phytanoyl-CoA dioxygenase family protein [Steroidobacteraceae bacterium]